MGGAKPHAHGWARNKTHLDGPAAAHAAAAVAGRCQRAAAAIGFETGALHEGSVAQKLPRCRSIATVTLCLTPPRSLLLEPSCTIKGANLDLRSAMFKKKDLVPNTEIPPKTKEPSYGNIFITNDFAYVCLRIEMLPNGCKDAFHTYLLVTKNKTPQP